MPALFTLRVGVIYAGWTNMFFLFNLKNFISFWVFFILYSFYVKSVFKKIHCVGVGVLIIFCFLLQIIMAKPAGGPKAKENKDWDED